jgi:Rod binding domain-containing protein
MATNSISGSLAAQAQTSFLQAREEHVLRQVQSAQSGNDDVQIEKSAKEFEAMLLGTWLQQAEQSMATVPGADDDEEMAGRDQMMSLGVQSLATSLSASGGIGIAAMIAKSLHSIADRDKNEPVAAAPNVADYLGKAR